MLKNTIALFSALTLITWQLHARPLKKVAVLEVQATRVEKDLLPLLTEILSTELHSLRIYKVVTTDDIQALIGFEKQKDLVGCTDAGCIAEIGSALGVDFILATHVGKVGQSYVVNMKLINITAAKVEGRVYEMVASERRVETLFDTIKRAVKKLCLPPRTTIPPAETSAIRVKKDTPYAETSTALNSKSALPNTEPTITRVAPQKRRWPWAFVGTGVGLVAFGVSMGALALKTKADAHEMNDNSSQYDFSELTAKETTFTRYRTLSTVGIISGITLTAAGILLYAKLTRKQAKLVRAYPVMQPGFAGIGFSLTY